MRKHLPIKPIYEEKEKFRKTWLKIFYKSQLVVFGLALEENETILRWLLIQRARYHKRYNIQLDPNYFILIDEYDNLSDGKKLFFKSLNFEFIHFKSSKEFYGDFWNHFL